MGWKADRRSAGRPGPGHGLSDIGLRQAEFVKLSAHRRGGLGVSRREHEPIALDRNLEMRRVTQRGDDLLGEGELVLAGQLGEHG